MRLILFIILLPFICTLSVNGTKKVRIGMTLAFSLEQDSFYATAINAIYLHVQQLNEQSKLFDDDTKIELFHLENDIQRPQILKAGVEFIKSDVLAIIGAGWSSLTDLLLLVTRNSQLPVCDGASTSPMLSNKVKYPNFFRTVPQDANQAEAIVGFIKSNGWKKIGIIYSNEPYGLGLTTHTEKLSALNGIQVLSKISYQPYAEKQSYVTLMQRMKETGVRIILIYCLQQSSFQSFLELAKDVGLHGEGYVWMGGDGVGGIPIPSDLMDGSIAFFPVEAQGPASEELEKYYSANRLTSNYQYKNYSSLTTDRGYEYFYTSCLDLIVMGLDNLLKSNSSFTWDDLVKRKLNQYIHIPESFNFPNFLTTTGYIQLNQFGDRKGDYYILNFINGKKEVVGKWENGKRIDYKAIIYSDGSTNVPSDGIIPKNIAYYVSLRDTFPLVTLLIFLTLLLVISRLLYIDLYKLYSNEATDLVRFLQLISALVFSFKLVSLNGIPTVTQCTIDNVIPGFCCSLFFSLSIASHKHSLKQRKTTTDEVINSWKTVQKALPWMVPTVAFLLYWNVYDPPVPNVIPVGYQSYVWACASESHALSDGIHNLLYAYNLLLLLICGIRIIKTFQMTRGQTLIDLTIICVLNAPIIAAVQLYTHDEIYPDMSIYLRSQYMNIASIVEILITHLIVLHFNKVNSKKSANKNLEMQTIKDNLRMGNSSYITSTKNTPHRSKITKRPLKGLMVCINDPQSYKSIFVQPQPYFLQLHNPNTLYLFKEHNEKLDSCGIIWESQSFKTFESDMIDTLTMSIKINDKLYIFFLKESTEVTRMVDYFDVWKDKISFNQFNGFE